MTLCVSAQGSRRRAQRRPAPHPRCGKALGDDALPLYARLVRRAELARGRGRSAALRAAANASASPHAPRAWCRALSLRWTLVALDAALREFRACALRRSSSSPAPWPRGARAVAALLVSRAKSRYEALAGRDADARAGTSCSSPRRLDVVRRLPRLSEARVPATTSLTLRFHSRGLAGLPPVRSYDPPPTEPQVTALRRDGAWSAPSEGLPQIISVSAPCAPDDHMGRRLMRSTAPHRQHHIVYVIPPALRCSSRPCDACARSSGSRRTLAR